LSLPGIHNLRIQRGDDETRTWTYKPGGVAANLSSGWTAVAWGAATDDIDAAHTWDLDNTLFTLGSGSDNVQMTFTNAKSSALSKGEAGFWWLRLTETATSENTTILVGNYEALS
jgi:hypothetical protein